MTAPVLLVEDNPGDVMLFKRALRREKLSLPLQVVRDGAEALAFLAQRGAHSDAPRPRLVLLDINLPRVAGPEVLKAIKSAPELAALPVIILTSSEAERERMLSMGAEDYWIKPDNIRDLQALVQKLAARLSLAA